tara:strand:- start:238 stop:441 length:204 start_codon:yes stop_codon:yes gene_type:complete
MNCKIIFEKYNYIINKIKNNEENIKLNNDSPLIKSYLLEDMKKLIKEKNILNEEIKFCKYNLNNEFN